jgi:hypothetical protein
VCCMSMSAQWNQGLVARATAPCLAQGSRVEARGPDCVAAHVVATKHVWQRCCHQVCKVQGLSLTSMPVRQHGTQGRVLGRRLGASLTQVQLCVHHAAKVGQPALAVPAPLC